MNAEAKNESTRWPNSPKPGGRVRNRYRITGTLTCRTPLHVGSGEESDNIDALVQTNYLGIPILTGSGLRGVIRHALLGTAGDDRSAQARVFALLGSDAEHAGNDDATSGKVCFRDAKRHQITNAVVWHKNAAPQWNEEQGTYQITSVVIDPMWGTCEEHLLYTMEVVPKGTKFEIEIIGNNLLDEELGMLLWALDKFNDSSGAVSAGAHSGRGFGRLCWSLGKIRLLGLRLNGAASGTATAPLKERILFSLVQKKVVNKLDGVDVAAAEFKAAWERVRPKVGGTKYHLELSYTLTVASGLVVRSGDAGEDKNVALQKFRLGQEANSKERGMQFLLSDPGQTPDGSEVASLAWQVVIDQDGRPQAQFQVAGSGVRGAMRKHFQKRLVIEKGDDAAAQSALDDLFGSTKRRGRIEFENAIPEGDKLRWLSEDHPPHDAGPTCKNPNVRVRERGPVDRITQGAKHGGLHHFMSVEKGSTFRGRVLIRDVAARDLSLLRLWSESVNQKLVVLGGGVAAGYGECTIGFDTESRPLHAGSLDPASLGADDPLKQAIVALLHSGQSAAGGEIKDPSDPLPDPVQNPAADLQQPASEPLHDHYMNPYDFVPFPRASDGVAYIRPKQRTVEQWETEVPNAGELLSGTITVKLKTLQPVHILGRWHGGNESFYSFHREAGVPVIPGASWRGMLRAFIEAQWNCWVSSYSRNADWHGKQSRNQPNLPKTPNPYSRQFRERYVGFNTETAWRDCSPVSGWKHASDPVIPNFFLPPEPEGGDWSTRPIDLATFLFGTVLQFRARDGELPKAESPALGGRLRFGSCCFQEDQLDHQTFWIPDQPGAALIGGPKPSKSSMLYFRYGTVVHRVTHGNHIAQFVAGPFRGRKFYFHQNWQACVQSYENPNSSENFWARGRTNVTHRKLECLESDQTGTFQIHFERLPWCFLRLLVSAIENPSTQVRHKLGYGKPFGFGSVKLDIADITVYSVEDNNGVYSLIQKKVDLDDLRCKVRNARAANWDWACDPAAFAQSDRGLRYILTYPSDPDSLTKHLFSYPGYKQSAGEPWVRGFARPNTDPAKVIEGIPNPGDKRTATIDDAKRYDVDGKKTLDLGVYQRRSTHFSEICKRAEVAPNDIHPEAAGGNPPRSTPTAGGGSGAEPRHAPPPAVPNSIYQPHTKRGERRTR